MLERFAVSIAATTILAVLGKLALLYHADKDHGQDWLTGPVEQVVLVHLLLAVFLLFFRGKMMHDDATFFADLAKKDQVFKTGKGDKMLVKLGLLLGYFSWLLWAPAIYFFEDRPRFACFLIASLFLSTIWLVIDIATRKTLEWRRAFWIVPNLCYIGLLALLTQPSWAVVAAIFLLVVLIIDWMVSDPLSGHI
ncbi:MAG TPA: hypothetical protein VKB34_15630 [Povalibacter sp.]|nr:hypothetical protein [Povalibacter sp.]